VIDARMRSLAVVVAVACLAGVDAPAGAGQAVPARTAAAAAPGPPSSAGRGPLDATPLHYQLAVTPDFGTTTFDGDLTIDLRVDKATTRITLDAVDLEIYDAEIFLPYDRRVKPDVTTDPAAGTASFTTSTRIYPGTIKLHIQYGGKLRGDGRGFYLARSNGRKYLLSQMEATDARRAFPCVDEPAFKASFALSAVVDQRLTAISNGRLVSDTPAEKYGKHVLRFGTTPRMPTYLVALAVGEFGCLEAMAESIPVRVCATPENKNRGAFVLEAARRALLFDTQYFTFKYPFRKLDLIAVPGGFPGAMENSAAIVFDEGMLVDPAQVSETRLSEVAETISHEVAHQWLGDIVTMRWWDDLWLNEGLATWMAPKAVAAWQPAWHVELGGATRTREAMRLDAYHSARPVRTAVATEAEIEESFDAMAYDKAAAVLRMVEAWVGPDVFRNALNTFVRAHAYESATAEDLWKELAAAADRPVDLVMRAFLSQPGVPLVTLDTSCEADETVISASVQRYTLDPSASPMAVQAGSPTPAPATPATPAGTRTAAAPVPAPPPAAPWPIPLQVRGVTSTAPMLTFAPRLVTGQPQALRINGCFPAVLVNSGATGYFHTASAPAALAHLTSVAASRMAPAERIRLLDDQWALAAAGLSNIGDYLAVVAALAGDTTPEVIEAIAGDLAFIREHVAGDSARDAFEAWVRRTMGPAAASLGWRAESADTDDRRRLRAAVVDILGTAGRDNVVLATARVLFVADASGAQPIDRALRASIARLTARTADAGLLAAMRARDSAETLASAGDAAFVTAALDEAVKGGPSETLPVWIAAGLENPAVNTQVWTFVKARWSDIEPSMGGPFALSRVVTAAGSFCDGGARDDVQRFFADKASTVGRTLQLTLERIDACRDFRLRQESRLADWLAAR
jgi:aminopeptidase N